MEPIVKQPVRDRNQGRRRRRRSARRSRPAPSPTATRCCSHITSISGFAEVDRLFGRAPKFTNADFIPIARFVADPCVLLVNDQQPYKTLKDFVDDAKKRPNEIIFSSSGLYGALHIPMALFMKAAGGLKLRHLPTNGGGPALDRAARQQFAGAGVVDLGRAVADQGRQGCGRWRCSAAERSKALPDVPTMKELGYDIEYYLWVGMFAPKGTPGAVIDVSARRNRQGRAHAMQFKTALTNLGQDLAYLDAGGLREVLGRRTPSASRTRSARSAACRDDDQPIAKSRDPLGSRTSGSRHDPARRSRRGRRVRRRSAS